MTEWRSKALPRYQRLTKKAEALIAAVYLAGTNTRRVKREPSTSSVALAPHYMAATDIMPASIETLLPRGSHPYTVQEVTSRALLVQAQWRRRVVRSRTRCSISRGEIFTPRPAFDDLAALNAWLLLRCEELAERRHTDQQHRTIAEVFADEKIELRPARAALSTVMSEKLCGSDPPAWCSMTGEEDQKTAWV